MELPPDIHPDITRLFAYYGKVAAADALPSIHNIDPLHLPGIVDGIVLIDVRRRPYRFRNRYAGVRIESFAGESIKGWPFAAHLRGDLRRNVELNLINVVKTKQPTWRRGKPMIRFDRANVELERVYLPLASDGQTVDSILSFTIHRRVTRPADQRFEKPIKLWTR
ncbi:MAG: PAS domain-containing protein [Alphaproteobacteria bacterium]|nr:PAS domain-containing protein [Alphaproteobacteria bacterium]